MLLDQQQQQQQAQQLNAQQQQQAVQQQQLNEMTRASGGIITLVLGSGPAWDLGPSGPCCRKCVGTGCMSRVPHIAASSYT